MIVLSLSPLLLHIPVMLPLFDVRVMLAVLLLLLLRIHVPDIVYAGVVACRYAHCGVYVVVCCVVVYVFGFTIVDHYCCSCVV